MLISCEDMLIYEIVKNVFFLGLGVFVSFVLAFISINTGTFVKDINKKFHYIIYITMFLTFIISRLTFGLKWYIFFFVSLSGWCVYKLFH